jgi:hypothetical protein
MFFKTIQRWFDRQIEAAWNRARKEGAEVKEMSAGQMNAVSKSARLGPVGSPGGLGHGMNFTIYQANGGHVLEFNEYDQFNDRRTQRLYIISSDRDLGQGLAEIITLELLKK